jgi:hypothetical protein
MLQIIWRRRRRRRKRRSASAWFHGLWTYYGPKVLEYME